MASSILSELAASIGIDLVDHQSLTGGDINDVFLLKSKAEELVVKINDASTYPGMFEAEAHGLRKLSESQSFRIPEVRKVGAIRGTSFLLMEYIVPGTPGHGFWDAFARNLARLHKITSTAFGLEQDNYIGSLPQYNGEAQSASEFYLTQRLEPQFSLASSKGYQFNDLDIFFRNLAEIIPPEPPSLIHGDLWNGNYMCDNSGKPVLIDPAVSYAPREMDLGMMQLFGGFPESVFNRYHEFFPLQENWKERIPLWQLYYLLVHLNLFGSGYLSSVKNIITRYT